jgi:glycosyltransferase involved in cell wall biosynthesis
MLKNINADERVPYTFEPVVLKYPEENKGLISIIIPIYNMELYLRECLDSILAQTFTNWEAILVNDGSTDKSPEICVEYAEKDSRFKYICKSNEGTNLSRKIGLENAKGEFVASLDSDDTYKPQFLEKMFTVIKENNSDFVWCNMENSNGKIYHEMKGYKLNENKLKNCYNMKEFLYSICNKIVKRDICAKILFPNTNLVLGEDFIQTFQIMYHSENAKFIPEALYLYRTDSVTSITSNASHNKKRNVQYVVYTVAVYLIMEHFFCADEAEFFFAEKLTQFGFYFTFNEKMINSYKIGYAKNFIPAFLRGLKKSKNVKFFEKTILIWACNGYTTSYRIYYKLYEIRCKFAIRTRIKRILIKLFLNLKYSL